MYVVVSPFRVNLPISVAAPSVRVDKPNEREDGDGAECAHDDPEWGKVEQGVHAEVRPIRDCGSALAVLEERGGPCCPNACRV